MVGIAKADTLTFKSGEYLRNRIVLATLSSRSVRFTCIRENDSAAPGLSPAEISFIRLMDKITSGSVIQINETGTGLFYKPGLLVGGDRLTHECHPSRCVSYYLEPLLMLAPFSKHPMNIILRGPTHSTTDMCMDTILAVSVPLLRRLSLGTPLSAHVEVKKRAMASGKLNGGGRGGVVQFRCDVLRNKLKVVELIEGGYVKRIRGIAFANRVSPGHISRMIDATRGVLNRFTPDVYVHTDHNNNTDCGVGFGLHLVAETTEGCLIGADWCSSEKQTTPEEVARAACAMLLEEISDCGCVDSNSVCLSLLYCAVADSDLSRVRIGRLSDASVQFLRDLDKFFGVVFKMKVLTVGEISSDSEDDSSIHDGEKKFDGGGGILMSCIGIGLGNVARQRF